MDGSSPLTGYIDNNHFFTLCLRDGMKITNLLLCLVTTVVCW